LGIIGITNELRRRLNRGLPGLTAGLSFAYNPTTVKGIRDLRLPSFVTFFDELLPLVEQ
jgi:hypothetical protein